MQVIGAISAYGVRDGLRLKADKDKIPESRNALAAYNKASEGMNKVASYYVAMESPTEDGSYVKTVKERENEFVALKMPLPEGKSEGMKVYCITDDFETEEPIELDYYIIEGNGSETYILIDTEYLGYIYCDVYA